MSIKVLYLPQKFYTSPNKFLAMPLVDSFFFLSRSNNGDAGQAKGTMSITILGLSFHLTIFEIHSQ